MKCLWCSSLFVDCMAAVTTAANVESMIYIVVYTSYKVQ